MPTGLLHFRHTVTIDGTDLAGITLAGATIDYGTRRAEEPPTPASAYFTLISADAVPNIADKYPGFSWGDRIPSGFVPEWSDKYEGGLPRLNLGTEIKVDATTPTGFVETWADGYSSGFDSTRFTGIITAIDVLPATITITAVSMSERLTRVLIDPSGWPQEPEIARVQRIASAAGVSVLTSGTSTATVAAKRATENPAPAWALLVEVANDCDAVLYATRTGEVMYRTRNATGGTTTDLANAATLLDGLQFTTEIGAVVNSVTVEYGPPDARAKATAEDADSIAKYGKRDRSLSSVLALATDANALAARILAHYKDPVWHMPTVTVNLRLAEQAGPFPGYLQAVLNTDLDDSIHLPALLPASPVDTYTSRVLGYREVLDPYSWSLTFSLNPAGWTKPDA